MNLSVFKPLDSAKHLPALDGIRGIAILLVLFFHSGLIVNGTGFWGQIYNQLARSCWCGVDLFFVLSGFLITGILLDTRDQPHYFQSFYARRILRIFPLYYGVLAWLFLQNPWFPDQLWYWLYLQNWGPTLGGAVPPMVVQPFWSLAVEEQFYLLWPFLIWCIPRRRLGMFCCLLFLGSLAARILARMQDLDVMTIYTVTPFRLDTLSAGALIAVWLRDETHRNRLQRVLLPGLGLSGLGLLALLVRERGFYLDSPLTQTLGYSLFSVFCALMIALVVQRSTEERYGKRFLENRLLRHLGNRSYAIYIFQMMVLIPINTSYQAHWKAADPSGWQGFLMFVEGVILILLLAELSWHCYEKQFLKLKRFFPRRNHLSRNDSETLIQDV